MRRRRDIKETNHRSTAFSSLADSSLTFTTRMDRWAEDDSTQGATDYRHEKVDAHSEDDALHERSRARMQTEKGLAYL